MLAKFHKSVAAALLIAASGLAIGAAEPAEAAFRPGGGGGFHGGGFNGGGFHGFGGGGFHGFGGGGFHAFGGSRFGGFSRFAVGRGSFFGARPFGAARYASPGFGGRLATRVGAATAATAAGAGAIAEGRAAADPRMAEGEFQRGQFQHGQFGWRDFHHHQFFGWGGGTFWPYAYDDLWDAALWPYGFYGPDYGDFWGYGYDDVFGGVLVPYASAGYAPNPPAPRAAAQQPALAPEIAATASSLCVSAQPIAAAVPIGRISDELKPNPDQAGKLQALTDSEANAAKALRASCNAEAGAPTNPVQRLDAVQTRLGDMLQAVDAVSGPLDAFYASLTDEQKARFNNLAQMSQPQQQQQQGAAPPANLAQLCGPQNEIPVVPVGDIVRALSPNAEQRANLVALQQTADKADQAILATCPADAPLTPTGRLTAIRTRLDAMLQGVADVRPALERFWNSLDPGEQAKLSAMMQGNAVSPPSASAH